MEGSESLDKYPVDSFPRGYCIIINNDEFTGQHPSLPPRPGSYKDVEDLRSLFDQQFGFKVLTLINTTEIEMMLQLKEIAERDHSSYSALLVIAMSHGQSGGIIFTHDCKRIEIHSLASFFTISGCLSLANKPKVFIVQACQDVTPNYQAGNVEFSESHPVLLSINKSHSAYQSPSPVVLIDPKTAINQKDFLFAFATIDGHLAMRDTQEGAWYIQELISILKKYSEESFTGILTEVNRRLNAKGQVCTYTSALCKELFLTRVKDLEHLKSETVLTPRQQVLSQRQALTGSIPSLESASMVFTSHSNSTSQSSFKLRYSFGPRGSPYFVYEPPKKIVTKASALIHSSSINDLPMSNSIINPEDPGSSMIDLDVASTSEELELMSINENNNLVSHNQPADIAEDICIGYSIRVSSVAYPNGYLVLVDNIDSETTRNISMQFSSVFRDKYKMQVFRFANLVSKAMRCLFSSLSKTDHSELSCLFVVVLSRGGKVKGVYDKNRKLLPLESICYHFNDENCLTLRGKPKIFLFETIVNNTGIVLNSNRAIRYPNIQDGFIVLGTFTASANVSYISKIADQISMLQGGRVRCDVNFIDLLRQVKQFIERSSTVGNSIINYKFSGKPLYFQFINDIRSHNFINDRAIRLNELKLALNFWSCLRTETLELFHENIIKILRNRRRVSKAKIVSSTMSIAGGATSIAGIVLFPATLGGSLGLSILGGLIAVLGGVGLSSSTVIEYIMTKRKLRKLYHCIEMDTTLCKIVLAQYKYLLNHNKTAITSSRGSITADERSTDTALNLSKMQLSMDSLCAGKNFLAIKDRNKSVICTGCVLGTIIGCSAFKGFVAGSVITLPFDVYELTTAIIRHQNHKKDNQDINLWLKEYLRKVERDKATIENGLCHTDYDNDDAIK